MANLNYPRQMVGLDAMDGTAAAIAENQSIAVLDTSEVRWFALGSSAPEVLDWFAGSNRSWTLEERCDIYQLHWLHDIGVKRRSRNTLEVKVRRAIGENLELQPDLAAPLEEWRKWSPGSSDPMAPSPDVPWIEIHKVVLTRTFMLAGGEVVGPAPHINDTLSGCDVEIVDVTIGGIQSWSLAFEAFGPKSDRRRAVISAWEMLIDGSGRFDNLGSYFERPAGYPEWLAILAAAIEPTTEGSFDQLNTWCRSLPTSFGMPG